MKKIMFLVLFLVLSGCISKEELAKKKGTWQVINVNCPMILAEKDGEREIFDYYSSFRGRFLTEKNCQNIKPGWIVVVGEYGEYVFFPPPTTTVIPGSTSK